MESGARIRKGAELGENTTILQDACVGRYSSLEKNVEVAPRVVLPSFTFAKESTKIENAKEAVRMDMVTRDYSGC